MRQVIRGNNKIFKDIFSEQTTQEGSKPKKGRSIELNAKRNECLIDRYFYYGFTTQNRYEVIIEKLSVEFFLSTVTIPKIIDDNYAMLATKKSEYKDIAVDRLKRKLASKWPHLSW
ncbi:hypothetical protein [Paraflavitalea speifideaquila]|uniref:hypothetical protein n=1 Tax=Paraflavitalea speifideaquila TaxID=3076558 RepID=UPI0028F0D19A|nr:hypothetical protein [Paraflavitalea speifideiaquila]